MKAIILAAGYATRLYPLTIDRPKPLLKIGEKTIIDYLLDRLDQLPVVDTVYLVTNARFYSQFGRWAEGINSTKRFEHFTLKIVNDKTTSNETRLGAVADIQYAIDQENIRDEIVITAGDNIFNFNFGNIYSFYKKKKSPVILVHPLEDRNRLTSVGVVERDETGRVIGFEEKPDFPKSNLIAPPLYFLPQKELARIKRFLNSYPSHDAPGHFIAWLQQQLTVYAYLMREKYLDIGTLEMYNKVKDGGVWLSLLGG